MPKAKKPKVTAAKSKPYPMFEAFCAAHKLPIPDREFVFHAKRKWRFDFVWIGYMVALEVEGGIWTNGAHVRGKHFEGDIEKYNEAVIHKWRVLRCTPEQIANGSVFALLARIL